MAIDISRGLYSATFTQPVVVDTVLVDYTGTGNALWNWSLLCNAPVIVELYTIFGDTITNHLIPIGGVAEIKTPIKKMTIKTSDVTEDITIYGEVIN